MSDPTASPPKPAGGIRSPKRKMKRNTGSPTKGDGQASLARLGVCPRGTSYEEHRQWTRKLWGRLDRDHSGDVSIVELNCGEIQDTVRSILAPAAFDQPGHIATYGRSEMHWDQVLRYFMERADANFDGSLSYEEFENFFTYFRNNRTVEEDVDFIFTMFDLDTDQRLDLDEMREICRFFMGRNPKGPELHAAWKGLDVTGKDYATREDFVRWLSSGKCDSVFRVHVLPVDVPVTEAPPRGVASFGTLPTSPGVTFSSVGSSRLSPKACKPAPGMLPGMGARAMSMSMFPPWNQRFNIKDPSILNQSYRGNNCMKTFFSRPQSLPELGYFFETHRGFDKHSRRLHTPQLGELVGKGPVLSTESRFRQNDPGASRHILGGTMRNTQGGVVPWRNELTPRELKVNAWEPGSLLLRCPGAPPAWLVHGSR